MCVLTQYDQIEPIYLPQSIVTCIYLHPADIYHSHMLYTGELDELKLAGG
jgi:hypothetical protein